MMLRGAAGGAASQSEGGGPPSMPGLPPGLTAHIMTIARGAAAEASRDASASTGFNAERGGARLAPSPPRRSRRRERAGAAPARSAASSFALTSSWLSAAIATVLSSASLGVHAISGWWP